MVDGVVFKEEVMRNKDEEDVHRQLAASIYTECRTGWLCVAGEP